MPNRLLFESLLTSGRWNDLGAAAQSFYVRLMLVADDFGAFDGRESVVANACYPTKATDVSEMLAALQAADLIVRYSNAGKPYIALMRWQNDVRGKRRFPAPPVNNDSADIVKYVGKFGRPIGWRNPGGCDPVSILLDAQMRPTVPQPREWRLVDKDYAPAPDGAQPLPTMASKPYAPVVDKGYAPVASNPRAQELVLDVEKDKDKASESASVKVAPQRGAQGLHTTAATTAAANGGIHLNPEGGWLGISEGQRLKWQEMFADLSIPDQLDRAAEWLRSRPEERDNYDAQPEGNYAFIVRWLLRESRAGTH